MSNDFDVMLWALPVIANIWQAARPESAMGLAWTLAALVVALLGVARSIKGRKP